MARHILILGEIKWIVVFAYTPVSKETLMFFQNYIFVAEALGLSWGSKYLILDRCILALE